VKYCHVLFISSTVIVFVRNLRDLLLKQSSYTIIAQTLHKSVFLPFESFDNPAEIRVIQSADNGDMTA